MSVKRNPLLFILIFSLALALPDRGFSQCELVINDPPTVCEGLTVDLTNPAITDGSSDNLTFTYWRDTTAETELNNPTAVDTSGVYFIKAEGLVDCEIILPVNVRVVEKPNLVINNPTRVCAPATVDITSSWITRGSDPGLTLTYWLDASGTRPLTFADEIRFSGTFYIKAEAEGGCLSFKPVEVTIFEGIDFVVHGPIVACAGDSVDLTLPEVTEGSDTTAILSYWTDPLAITPLDNPQSVKDGGTYFIKAFVSPGCVSIAQVEVEFVDPYAELDIAILSVDSISQKNVLYWEPPEETGVEYINIYKKNYQTGDLDLLETISDYSSGSYLDDQSEPSGSFESYAISVVDSCGNESDTSALHKTINLVGALSGSAVNLLWNEYLGREIAFYRIMRKAEGGEWETAGTVLGNVQIFSDSNPGELPKTYVIEAIPRYPELTLGKNSYSNELLVVSSGVDNMKADKNIRIYPNPFRDRLNIELDWEEGRKGTIDLYNILGEKCHQWEFNSPSLVLDTGDIPEGTYILKIKGSDKFNKVVIK